MLNLLNFKNCGVKNCGVKKMMYKNNNFRGKEKNSLVKIRNFDQKLKCWSQIEILVKKKIVWSKFEIWPDRPGRKILTGSDQIKS